MQGDAWHCWCKTPALTIEALAPALIPLVTRGVKFSADERALRLPAAFALFAAAEWILDLARQRCAVGVLLFGWRTLQPGGRRQDHVSRLLAWQPLLKQPWRATITFQFALPCRMSGGIPWSTTLTAWVMQE